MLHYICCITYAALSHPSRVRGLKFCRVDGRMAIMAVAPFTGAWIEIRVARRRSVWSPVAPFTGAWIEMNI